MSAPATAANNAAPGKARRPSKALSVSAPHVMTANPPASPMIASSTLRKTFGGSNKNRRPSERRPASKRDMGQASLFSAHPPGSNNKSMHGHGSLNGPSAGSSIGAPHEYKAEHHDGATNKQKKKRSIIPNDMDVERLTEQFSSRRHSVTNNLHQSHIQAAQLAAAAVAAAGGVPGNSSAAQMDMAASGKGDGDESMDTETGKAINTGAWSKEEDQMLKVLQSRLGTNNWNSIAEQMPGRSRTQCLTRWNKFLRPDIRKGQWTAEEDALLVQLVQEVPKKNWGDVAVMIKGRSAKQVCMFVCMYV
jgi:hypothetical protein